MHKVRPVLDLGPQVLLCAIECTRESLVARGSRHLKIACIARKPVFDFRFSGCRIQRTVVHGERPVGETCRCPEPTLCTDRAIEQFIQVEHVAAVGKQFPYLSAPLGVEFQILDEFFSKLLAVPHRRVRSQSDDGHVGRSHLLEHPVAPPLVGAPCSSPLGRAGLGLFSSCRPA